MESKWTIQSIGSALKIHIAGDVERDKKTDAMYKLLIIGNGLPPLPEIVRNHTEWIDGQKKDQEEKRKLKREYGKGMVFLILGQVATLIGSAIAIGLSVKK